MSSADTWAVAKSDMFDESMAQMEVTFSDITEKVNKFIETKIPNPNHIRYGKHDRRMIGEMSAFHHAHLRDDAVLIYRLRARTLTLIYIATHAAIEGRRCRRLAERLERFA